MDAQDKDRKELAPRAGDSTDIDVGEKPAQQVVAIRPQERKLHDPDVTLEEYFYYAELTRQEEDTHARNAPKTTLKDILFPSRGEAILVRNPDDDQVGTINTELNLNRAENRVGVSDTEWTNASRALRSATGAAAFYLITTDLLGPFGVGFSIGTMGWGEGIGFFTLFGLMAGVCVSPSTMK